MRAFVDTNVLVYAVDRADPRRRGIARDVLREGADEGLVVSAQVLAEFLVAVRRLEQPLETAVARRLAGRIAGSVEVVPQTATLVLGGAGRAAEDGISIWDAMIVEAAVAAGCDVLLTEDLQHGRDHDGVVVTDPFRT